MGARRHAGNNQICNFFTIVFSVANVFLTFNICVVHSCSSSHKFKGLGDSCDVGSDCSTTICHESLRTCSCPEMFDYGIGKMVDQLYVRGKCYSRIRQQCTLSNVFPIINCIEGSTCMQKAEERNEFNQSMLFGKCKCKTEFISIDNGKRCINLFDKRLKRLPRGSKEDEANYFNTIVNGNSKSMAICKILIINIIFSLCFTKLVCN